MDAARKIVLCADDYGLSPGVSRGIRELLTQRRLSATSCMVVFPEFAHDGPLLKPFFEQADIGLHFTLTAELPLSSVLIAGWLRRLDVKEVRRELNRQLDIFASVMGRPPAYIDGHQHVHLLPGVREAVADAAKDIGSYVRLTREPITSEMMKRPAPVDSTYLSWASQPLARLAAQRGIRTNTGFRGVRSFKERAPFRTLFQRMIAGAANGSIIMCHAGHVDDILIGRDPIQQQREEEYAYLTTDGFTEDISNARLQLAALREALAN
jgi:predicted glycoside hydrolase/deacetylase ChbG (UPF0249 family)